MPPFTYEALPPADIEFVPLKQTRSFRADELMQVRAATGPSLSAGDHLRAGVNSAPSGDHRQCHNRY